MNKYVKLYLLRGLIFSGLGPIVAGIVYICLEASGTALQLNGFQVFMAILTTYIMAFVHAGSSVFPTIEHWSKIKAMFFQFVSIYTVYTVGYLINDWIPLDWRIIAIYTGCFLGGFLLIWLIVYLTTKKVTTSMNAKLEETKKNIK